MRLHRLEVTAFGPFAGTVRLDFEELNDAGLFLLTGPTGAGKSSLLDAVCFALYGTVPGVRGVKALKSQHAPAHVRPEVLLDFSVRGRRFVLRRTPEWWRPKKRGEGLLSEKAAASLTETTDGTDRFLSARAAEVGLLVGDLMGMTSSQFVQVAMLPQGEFQTFLRASSQERHDVLQHLFRTTRFSRIEDWVHDRSRTLRELSEGGRNEVRRILDAAAERAATPLPDDMVGDALATAAADGRVAAWVRERLEAAVERAGEAARCDDRLASELTTLRARLEEAVRQAEHRDRRRAALATLAEQAASQPEAETAAKALAAHERATRCRPLVDLLGDADRERGERTRTRGEVLARLGSGLPTPLRLRVPAPASDEALGALVDRVRADVARLDALRPRQQAAEEARAALVRHRRSLETATYDLEATVERAEQLPAELAALAGQLETAAVAAGRREALDAAVAAAELRLEAATRLAAAQARLVAADDARRAARDAAQDARHRVQEVVARRLAGMAAELAGRLADGRPCQVCGSEQHPSPARAADDAATAEEQAAAEDAYDVARASLDAAERELAEQRSSCDTLAATAAGSTPAEAAHRLADLQDQLADATAAQARHEDLTVRVETLREELTTLGARRSDAAAVVAELRQVVAAHERTLAEAAEALLSALAIETPSTTQAAEASELLDRRLSELGLADRLLTDARLAVGAADTAEARHAGIDRQVRDLLAEHGFGTVEEATAALLDDARRRHAEELLRRREAERARACAVLDDLDGASEGPEEAAGPADDPDSDDAKILAEALADLQTAAAEATRRRHLCDDRVSALTGLLDRLDAAMREWAPLRDETLRAESMARLVRGMGHDNQLQMRLSAYVLAARLDQVVAAANERLGQMRDQRYLLQRTGRAERRSAQAGLGLEIVDQWTGDVRAPTTLSGGETFVVSLSLALGLADVVTHEAGGTEIQTLFVDEGFGTLDADTLDDVMDRLDGLRAGGRTVGVVSHVTELRNRIPTQVRVEKGRAGSTVTVGTLVG